MPVTAAQHCASLAAAAQSVMSSFVRSWRRRIRTGAVDPLPVAPLPLDECAEYWSLFSPAESLRESVEARRREGDPPSTIHVAPDHSVVIWYRTNRGPQFVATTEEELKCRRNS